MGECEGFLYIFIVAIVFYLYMYLSQRNALKKLEKMHYADSKLIKRAYFDPLTSLPNNENIRTILHEQISRCHRHHKSFFTVIVKVYDVSDDVIIESGLRLFNSVRDEDIVGHLSRDLFIIVFNEYLEASNVDVVVQKIRSAFEKKFAIKKSISRKVSININVKNYPEKSTVDELITYTVES